ncbi:unnamed protein product [Heligmosomoides polygyrus]|uniref:Cu2_monoox_C domain-containing protein n=1 Tax=Heligmosomoides polygyrus TaxID=6339 RepID=A0A3P8AMP2_HELPZ|nr:unnamed protein product [Heligmosomoides polygyrus]
MNAHTVSKRLVQPELGRGNCRSFTILEGCLHLNADDFARRPNRVLMFYEGLTDKDIPAKEFISSPVGNYVDIYCFPGPVMGGLSDLTEKRFFQDAKLTKPGINNTDIAKDGQTAKAVCCGHKYAEDFNKWPYTFTCQGGTWFPKTECNDDQYGELSLTVTAQERNSGAFYEMPIQSVAMHVHAGVAQSCHIGCRAAS